MVDGAPYKKTTTALNLLMFLFALYIADAVLNIVTAGLQYGGVMNSSSLIGPAGNVNQGQLGLLCLVGGIGCLMMLGLMALFIIVGVFMLLSKREVQEIEGIAIPAGVLMIIAGVIFIISFLSIPLFLIAIVIYLRKIVRPGVEMFLYIGTAALGMGVLVSVVGGIASVLMISTLLSLLTNVVSPLLYLVGFILFLVAVLSAKGNWASWHKVTPFMGQMPPMYPSYPGTWYPPGPGGYAGYPPQGGPPGLGGYPGYPPHGGLPSQPGQAHPPQYR
jgi:hypothetical protein